MGNYFLLWKEFQVFSSPAPSAGWPHRKHCDLQRNNSWQQVTTLSTQCDCMEFQMPYEGTQKLFFTFCPITNTKFDTFNWDFHDIPTQSSTCWCTMNKTNSWIKKKTKKKTETCVEHLYLTPWTQSRPHHSENTFPTMMHGVGSIILWGAASFRKEQGCWWELKGKDQTLKQQHTETWT